MAFARTTIGLVYQDTTTRAIFVSDRRTTWQSHAGRHIYEEADIGNGGAASARVYGKRRDESGYKVRRRLLKGQTQTLDNGKNGRGMWFRREQRYQVHGESEVHN